MAAIRTNKYAVAKALPAADAGPERFGTDIWFKVSECPPAWGDKLLQARLFAWDDGRKAWADEPVAVSDRIVFGKGRLWQHNLTLLAAKGSDRATAWRTGKPNLPPGKYLAKFSVDADGRLAKDWKAELGKADESGQIDFTTRWRDGYGSMTAVTAAQLQK